MTTRYRYRYLTETETPATTTPSIGRLVAVGLGLLILAGSAMAWAAQPPQTPTQGAVSVPESDIRHEFTPAWVWLDPLQYPCPKGQRRMYREISPYIWRADCEVTP
jgi:hypothetical protein